MAVEVICTSQDILQMLSVVHLACLNGTGRGLCTSTLVHSWEARILNDVQVFLMGFVSGED